MRDMYSSVEKKMFDERAKFTRKCSCGHSIMVYPTMKKDYITCSWCQKRVFKDSEKQREYDEKIKREEFRMNMWNMICSN